MSNADELAFQGTARFAIEKRLGQGGFGTVYQAFDHERKALVALKTLNETAPESLYRFKQEFRALADIAHPNLASLYELLSDGQQWFFTMEMVDGVNILDYIRAAGGQRGSNDSGVMTLPFNSVELASDQKSLTTIDNGRSAVINASVGPIDLTRLRSALKQLAEGIFALHQAGKLHCDIKPSNILVTAAGRVVILDFGLVTELAATHSNNENIVGTPIYMSPEQIGNRSLSEASDWYSVGVLLFEALTGEYPFDGSLQQIFMDKQRLEAIAPSALVPDLPDDLDKLCQALLRRQPAERPAGKEILQRLGSAETAALKLISAAPASTQSRLFIGRAYHLSILREAFQICEQGRPAIVYVRGRSGIGKSALARQFLAELQQRAVVILSGRCYERESVPYKAMDSLVDELSWHLKSLPTRAVEALLPRNVLALARLFPVLMQVPAVAGAQRQVLDIPDSLELRQRAFSAMRELLARLAEQKRVVLFIDDLQWGDLDSMLLLAEILLPPDPPPIMLMANCRSEDVAGSDLMRAFLPSIVIAGSPVKVYELNLEALTENESRALALGLLQHSEAEIMEVEAIIAEAKGNPFFVDELVRYAKKILSEAAGDNGQKLKVKITSLAEALKARISWLPDEARLLLEVVAVAGQPIEIGIAKQVAQVANDNQTAIDILRTAHLVRTRGLRDSDLIEAYHDRISETALSQLSGQLLQEIHGRLAIALEAAEHTDPEILARHYLAAGDGQRAAEYTVKAALKASEALAFDHASQLYERALALRSTDDELAAALRVNLADALANAGRGAPAANAYLRAAESYGANTNWIANIAKPLELQQRAAEQLLISGHIDEGLAVLRKVLKKIGMEYDRSPSLALLAFFITRIKIRLRGLRFRQSNAQQVAMEDLVRIDACWSVATGLALTDTIRGFAFQARHLLLALRSGEPYRIARALSWEVAYCATNGSRNQDRTKMFLRLSKELAEQINNPHALALSALTPAIAAFLEGRWQEANVQAERAYQILREQCTGVTWELDTAYLFSLRSLVCMGELNRLSANLPALLKESQQRGDLYSTTSLRTRVAYMVSLTLDDPACAQQELDESIEQWSQQGFHAQHYFALIGQAEIMLYSHRGEAAWEHINRKWRLLERSFLLRVQCLLIESLHLRARCALAAAVRNETEANNLLVLARRDAKLIRRENTGWGNALAQLINAGIALGDNDKNQAISILATAEAGLRAANMHLYAAAAQRRRGELMADRAGAQLIETANAWMHDQNIRAPERMLAMLTPGKWSV